MNDTFLCSGCSNPIIAPPSISISTSYPGASPENLYNSVTRLIEEELNGASGILNFESTSDSLGQVEIIANFVPGTETSAASVEVQNRLKRVEARLPRAVIQQGILVEEASSAVLQIITLRSTDGSLDEVGLGDFMIRNILGEVRRIPGVGRATLYSTERSLRIWIDPEKLVGYGLTSDDVNKAIASQNAQVASGSIGAEPSTPDTRIAAQVLVKGQLSSPDEFGSIILRASPDGSTVRLRDVARIEIGGLSYQFQTRLNGKPTAGLSVLLSPTGNALATASAVENKMKELSRFFPANIVYDIPYNITPVVKASINKVLMTLAEAVVLVFIVMFLFLQNIRYTMIPTIVVPVALLGACAVLMLMGYSINMLTMFGMVLAVGILVDGGIVVVEYADRKMAEGLPKEEAFAAAGKRMFWPVLNGTLTTLCAFIPFMFWNSIAGKFMSFLPLTLFFVLGASIFVALIFTPALGSLAGRKQGVDSELLEEIEKSEHGDPRQMKGFMGWYARVLWGAAIRPVLTTIAILCLIVTVFASFWAMQNNLLGMHSRATLFFLEEDPEWAQVFIKARGNLSVQAEDALVRNVEARLAGASGRNVDGIEDQKRNGSAHIVLNWNLYNGGADTARVNQQKNLLNQAADVRDRVCRDTRQVAAIAYNDTRKLTEQLVYLERNTLAIEKARDAYRQQFDIGQRSLLDLLNAENELYTAKRSYANAESDLQLAYARTQAANTAQAVQKTASLRQTSEGTPRTTAGPTARPATP